MSAAISNVPTQKIMFEYLNGQQKSDHRLKSFIIVAFFCNFRPKVNKTINNLNYVIYIMITAKLL